ncbi:hypothetical protein [Streptomyces sp. NPDC001108]
MTWIHEDDTPGATRHAGYLLARLADGTIPTYRVGKLLAERTFADSWDGDGGWWQGPDQGRPDEQPAQLVPACECGWYGPDLPYDIEGGHTTPPPYGGQPMRDAGSRAAMQVWRDHAAAALTSTGPAPARQQLAQLGGTLAELADERPRAALTLIRQMREIAALIEPLAIAGALRHHITWDTIGSDLRQTRQAVNGRYRKPSADLSARVNRLTGTTVETLLTRPRKSGSPPPGIRKAREEIRSLLLEPAPTDDESATATDQTA